MEVSLWLAFSSQNFLKCCGEEKRKREIHWNYLFPSPSMHLGWLKDQVEGGSSAYIRLHASFVEKGGKGGGGKKKSMYYLSFQES